MSKQWELKQEDRTGRMWVRKGSQYLTIDHMPNELNERDKRIAELEAENARLRDAMQFIHSLDWDTPDLSNDEVADIAVSIHNMAGDVLNGKSHSTPNTQAVQKALNTQPTDSTDSENAEGGARYVVEELPVDSNGDLVFGIKDTLCGLFIGLLPYNGKLTPYVRDGEWMQQAKYHTDTQAQSHADELNSRKNGEFTVIQNLSRRQEGGLIIYRIFNAKYGRVYEAYRSYRDFEEAQSIAEQFVSAPF